MNVFQATRASAIHRAEKHLEWEDKSLFRRQTKHYAFAVTWWTREEAERNTGRSYSDDDYYRLDFVGDLPPNLREHAENIMQPYTHLMNELNLSPDTQQLLRKMTQGMQNGLFMVSGLMEEFQNLGIDPDGWTPL